ncbi:MAG: histidine phosphatase family protein [Phycisphaerales bacterium]|nr:MAG: histidine phosphatase family protein [Phycisphaerales bacterium]
MASLILIPWSETEWSPAGRIISRTSVPLTKVGREQSASWGTSMVPLGVNTVYSGEEQSGGETARLIAERCGARHKIEKSLAEVDAGLWTGLTFDELKRRDPKVFKRWCEDPTSVCPPEGEDLVKASERLRGSLAAVAKKHGDRNVVVVIGPVAFGVTRCVIESVALGKVRSMMQNEPVTYEIRADGKAKALVTCPRAPDEDESDPEGTECCRERDRGG